MIGFLLKLVYEAAASDFFVAVCYFTFCRRVIGIYLKNYDVRNTKVYHVLN